MNTVPFRLSGQAAARRAGRRERIGALASLPIFLRLSGKRVVVVGGSDAAAWKIELLVASGANVRVVTKAVGPVLAKLIEAESDAGRITVEESDWTRESLRGSVVAIGDFEDDEEAERFHTTCREVGVPVNVIDRPDYCDFQFGSIVNRGPVVIGISTDGAAPILGQAIRRRIEAALPPFVAEWANIARLVRRQVTGMLSIGRQRREFWERFVDHAFAGPPPEDAVDRVIGDCRSVVRDTPRALGRAMLIAASHDPEQLTIGAMRRLQSADIILHTPEVPNAVLELARREAVRHTISPQEMTAVEIGKSVEQGRAVAAVTTRRDMRDLEAAMKLRGVHVERI